MPLKTRTQLRTIHVFTERFTEGEWHWFKVLKELFIPGHETFYLLESASGNRLLMPTAYYKDYGISIGKPIFCRIDKINCSGRIFLEPEHPFYKPGTAYTFRVTNIFSNTDKKGRKQKYMQLTGPQNNKCTAICEEELAFTFPAIVMANFIRTRKGVLIINNMKVINNC